MAHVLAEVAVGVTGRRTDTRLVVQVWLGTRLVMALVGLWVAVSQRRTWDAVVAQWDVLHFYEIARNGYANPQEMAFFPGLPLVLRAGATVGVPMALTGVLLAAVCSLAAALALGRLGGTWAAVAWLLAPTGVFTVVPYTEAPFCAAAFWAWERASGRHWGPAALLATLACTLRVSGLFLIGALAVLAVVQWLAPRGEGAVGRTSGSRSSGTRPSRSRSRRRGPSPWLPLLWLVVPTAVLLGYAAYLHLLTGTWTAWFSAQAAGWQRGFHWPWEAFRNSWDSLSTVNPAHPEWVWIFRAEMVSWLVGLSTTVVLLVRRRPAQASWVGVQVLAFSLSYWFMSVARAVLLWFPLWLGVGEVVESRGKGWAGVGWLVAAVALVVQGVWAWLYFTGRWAS